MSEDETEHPFDMAKRVCEVVNDRMAETDGAIAGMGFSGAIGYHHFVATGETEPEYLWQVALFQAIEDTVLEMIHVDASDPQDARHQLERDLERSFDPFVADQIADEFEDNLRNLIDYQEDQSSATGAIPGDD